MKRCILLLGFLFSVTNLMAQENTEPYGSEWNKADSLLDKGLPESARKVVDKIYASAQRNSQQVQMLKAQLYYLRINQANAEQADSINIAYAEAQIRNTAFPINAVWRSITAQLYWNYYQQHRYEILNRTTIASATATPPDFEQWDANQFFNRSTELYITSLGQAGKLKRIPIDSLDPVLIKGINTRHLRPTLFDLLAFRAIEYFQNDEKDLTKPAFAFVLDDAGSFAPAAEFVRLTFPSKDSLSPQRIALSLYQQTLAMHLNDEKPDALIDADLQRLQFVYQHSVHPDKKALYRTALEDLSTRYASNPLAARASFRIAELLMEDDYAAVDGDEAHNGSKADLRKIKGMLDAIIARYPESEGGVEARQLLRSITAPSLSLTAEEAVLPHEPSKILVTYKNVPKAYFRIVKVNPDSYREDDRYNNDKYTKTLLAGKPVQSFFSSLPGTADFTQHSAEVKVEALPLGMYAIIISAKESFETQDNALSYAIFQVTQLAVVTTNTATPVERSGRGQSHDFAAGFVLDRREGTPISGASVAYFTQEWNNRQSRYTYKTTPAQPTGYDGAFNAPSRHESFAGMVVKLEGDAFYSNDYLNFYQHTQEAKETERTFLFTDRSIYRPGQTIFFKGILVRSAADRRSNDIIPGRKVDVTFYDVNHQKVASQSFITNEWGSFSGSFTAPQSGLTGQMHIESGNGSVYVSVEEYKRPKFHVEWDTLKSDYALNEAVSITGHAEAYAGNNVDGATVKYRVVRNVRWPFWWYAWRYLAGPGRNNGDQQVTEGTTTTDAAGKFTIRFTALPDRSVDERSLPVFTYTVYADVTDLNGETRSGAQSISVGYRSLQITADIPEQASRKDLDTLRITTQNLNGNFVPASVSIKIAALDQPQVVYRKRYWPLPDQFTMDEWTFRKDFPRDAYKDEDDYRKWPEAEIVLERTITTTKQGTVIIPESAFFNNGWYCITISAKDKNGKPIEEKKFVQVWDESAEGKPASALLVRPDMQTAEPGQWVRVGAVSALNSPYIIRRVMTMHLELTSGYKLTEGVFGWSWLLKEADRGGIALSYLTVKDNRVYTASARIDVPWNNKDLSIEWETHRDKLQPGQKETWTMIVRGNEKDKVAAEMAAALYDASLDAFRPHGWGIGNLFPSLNANLSWNAGVGFGQANGRQVSYFSSKNLPYYQKSYDALLLMDRYDRIQMGGGRAGRTRYVIDGVQLPPGATNFTNLAPGAVITETVAAQSVAAKYGDVSGGLAEKGEEKSTARHMILPEPRGPGEIANPNSDIPLRKNLQETAFFYPQLHTDADGAVRIEFTIPEALTEWRLLAFAHTKDMRSGVTTGIVKTQKDLMVQPGLPRFLRQGDEISIATKIVNLSDADVTGTATLEIIDALSTKTLDGSFRVSPAGGGGPRTTVSFSAPKGGSTNATWTIHVPEARYEPVIIRIRAKAGSFTDGEENTLPVLTNRMLVTEALPLWINGSGTKNVSFDKLKASGESKTIAQHSLTVEYTSNPAWLAVKALPYLMEYPYECAEQTFNRFYANALAAHILDRAPKVKAIFKKWREETLLSSFRSPLQMNQELKSALLEETPWVLAAESEEEQRKSIAMLFEADKLAQELDKSAGKLADMQMPEGGWAWFKGADRPDRYITQYILTGIGRLQHLGVSDVGARRGAFSQEAIEKAIVYLDRQMQADYDNLLRNKVDLKLQQIGYFIANKTID